MSKDFRATQVETAKIIATGSLEGVRHGTSDPVAANLGLAIYSGSVSTNREGGIPSKMLDDVGSDVFLFISGSISNSDFSRTEATLFGGDVVISGTLYAERQVIEVDSVADGNFFVTGSLFQKPDASTTKSAVFRSHTNTDILVVDATNSHVEVTGRVGINDDTPDAILDIQGGMSSGVPTLLVDHDDASTNGIDINLATTSGIGIDVAAATNTGRSFHLQANSLSSGNAMEITSNSTNLNGGSLLDINYSGASTNPYSVAQIVKSATNLDNSNAIVGLDIDFDGTAGTAGRALRIDSEQTDGIVAEINGDEVTSGTVIDVSADGLQTGGSALKIDDNSSHVGDRDTVQIIQQNTSAVGAVALSVTSAGGKDGVFIDKDYSDTGAATINGIIIDLDKTGASTSNNTIVGADVSTRNTTATNGTNEMIGIKIDSTLTHAADAGSATVKAIEASATAGTNGAGEAIGGMLTVAGGDINTGLKISAPAGGSDSHIRLESSANANDLFKISVGADGVTTMSTVEDGVGSNANLNISVDGDISINPAAGSVSITGSVEQTGDLSLLANAKLRFNNPGENDQFIYGTNSHVVLDVDNYFYVDYDINTQFRRGGTEQLEIGMNGAIFNDTAAASNDFRVESNTLQGAILVDSGDNTVVLGSNATTFSTLPVEAQGTDIAIVLSGSAGTKGTSTRGVVLLPGDVVISGSLYGGSPLDVKTDIGLTGSMRFKEQSAPATYNNEAVLYAKDVSGVTKLFMKQSDGVEVGPLGSGGSLDDGYDTPDGGGTKSTGVGGIINVDGQPVQMRIAGGKTMALAVTGTAAFGDISSEYSNHLPPMPGPDTSFFVSGAIGSRSTGVSGTAVFGGDVVVSGTISVNRGQAGAGSAVTVTTDGKVGIGTDNPSYKLEVGGNASLGEYLYHRNNSGGQNTFMRFEDDKVSFTAGGQSMLSMTENGLNTQILVLSGGAATDPDESTYLDTNFFVSGSKSSKGTGIKGTAVFGGDLVVSGAIYADTSVNVAGDLNVDSFIKHTGDTDTFIQFANDSMGITVGNKQLVQVAEVNAGQDFILFGDGNDVDFRFRTENTDYGLFIEGSTDRVGIGSSSPGTLLQLEHDQVPYITLKNTTNEHTDGGAETKIIFEDHNDTALAQIQASHDGAADDTKGDLIFSTHDGSSLNESMRIDSGGRVGIGTNNPTSTLYVKDSAPTVTIQRESNSNDSTIAFLGAAGFTGAIMHLSSSNDLVFKTHDGSTPHEILRLGSHYGSDNRQVIMLSGSEMHVGAMQPKEAQDINFFVSGSMMSRGTGTKGTAVFGGDLVVSGAAYTGRVLSNEDSTSFIDLAQNSIEINANHTVSIHDVIPSEFQDTNFFVSGSIGSRGNPSDRGTSVFGGDVVVSGSLRSNGHPFIKCFFITAASMNDSETYFSWYNGATSIANPTGGTMNQYWKVFHHSASLKSIEIFHSNASNRFAAGFYNYDETPSTGFSPKCVATGSTVAGNWSSSNRTRGSGTIDFTGKTLEVSGSNIINPGDVIGIFIKNLESSGRAGYVSLTWHFDTYNYD